MPQPVLKIEEISDELNVLLEKRRRFETVDEFTLKRLKNEAKKFLSKEPSLAYMFLGTLSIFEDDIDRVHENYKKSSNLSEKSSLANLYLVPDSILNSISKICELEIVAI